ncbi:unnamed protein product [Fusarium graminearum]|uniref:Uncharacterized protein n=1 Tax=Gibberella zeae TaxID=5518 RepID=A0A9N8WR33_GIBZA|nr:unnamed protein product [Fusarium graminearum]CAG1985421.1 unnamed protein product [Fusarium graminearum]CAG2010716.1 unnamed protein product [Fusarium graminearum]
MRGSNPLRFTLYVSKLASTYRPCRYLAVLANTRSKYRRHQSRQCGSAFAVGLVQMLRKKHLMWLLDLSHKLPHGYPEAPLHQVAPNFINRAHVLSY